MNLKKFLKSEDGKIFVHMLDEIKTDSDIETYLQKLKSIKNVNYDEDEVRLSLYLVKDNNLKK